MTYACHNCAYNATGETLAGLACTLHKDAEMMAELEKLRQLVARRCVNCKRATQDDIRIAKTPKARLPDTVTATPANEPKYATNLPPEVEDTLRQLFCTVSGLDLLDALLLLHVAQGGTPNQFGDTLNRLVAGIRSYGDRMSRFTARRRWIELVRKFAPFGVLKCWSATNCRKGRKNAF